jgi:hypothetical protein
MAQIASAHPTVKLMFAQAWASLFYGAKMNNCSHLLNIYFPNVCEILFNQLQDQKSILKN